MSMPGSRDFPPRVAVLVPCYNEEASIRQVIDDFRASLPGATIHVFFAPDGSMGVKVPIIASADRGTYRISDDGHVCVRLEAWGQGIEDCGYPQRGAGGSYLVYDDGGSLALSLEVKPGNPEGIEVAELRR